MAFSGTFWGYLHRFRVAAIWVIIASAYLLLLWTLRSSTYYGNPLLDTYLEMAGSLVAFTFAANALVRFRGTHDRVSLILAFAFVLAGLVEAATSMTAYRAMLATHGGDMQISIGWLAGRSLLGILLLVALAVEGRIPMSRDPAKEMAAATLIVGATAYLTIVAFFLLPAALKVHPESLIPRAWDLMPAAIYLAAAVGYGLRLGRVNAALDRALFIGSVLNVFAHVAMSQSQRALDSPFTLAHVLVVSSYAIVLGGTLLDNAQLFDEVSHMAASDSLTGLANHRRLFEVLDTEIQRSQRTGRRFAVLLFDLDGLKQINDRYGHLTGSRALKRVGVALRSSSRSIDTAARYGGDEFALVLPEAGEREAKQAALRICERLAKDGHRPVVTVSVGLAVYPTEGTTIEKLLGSADKALYRMKGRRDKKFRLGDVAACL